MSSIGGEMWGGNIDPNVMTNGGVSVVNYAPMGPRGPKRCPARFEMKEVKDEVASRAAQRPIFKMIPWVTIFYPGGDTFEGPPSEDHKEMYPDLFQRLLEKGTEPGMIGTPLSQVSFINPARARELQYFKVETVEHLADLLENDSELRRCGPQTREEAKQAHDFLRATKDAAFANEIFNKIDLLNGRIEVLEEENATLKKTILEGEDNGIKSYSANQSGDDSRTRKRSSGAGRIVKSDSDGDESSDGS